MNFIGWNCQGKGKALSSSTKMEYLARLMNSTNAQVTFVSETRSSKITPSQLNARFNSADSYVVPSDGLSGGLWLLWFEYVEVDVRFSNHFMILAVVIEVSTKFEFVLACVYGDPHHRLTKMIWDNIFNFVNENLGKPVGLLR